MAEINKVNYYGTDCNNESSSTAKSLICCHFAHLEKIKIAKKCGDKLDCISSYRIFARVKIRKL